MPLDRDRVHASGSQAFDRVVRVDRNTVTSDGAFGSLDNWTTIIDRLWVRIYPVQHRRRLRDERGKSEVGAKGRSPLEHRALADPSINGRTIRIADRMVDEKNNQTWEVIELGRPRGSMPYNAYHQFTVKLITDAQGVVVS